MSAADFFVVMLNVGGLFVCGYLLGKHVERQRWESGFVVKSDDGRNICMRTHDDSRVAEK